MGFINLLSSAWPEGNFWASIIRIFDFVGSYAWTIIIFTIALKLLLSPMDFLQRYFTNKTTRAQAKLKPQMDKLKKLYGQNQTLLYQKQNELYQKSGVSMKSSCVVMIVYMALTLLIFISLFGSMQSIAAFKIKAQYQDLQQTYYSYYNETYLQDYLEVDFLDDDYLNDPESYIQNKELEKGEENAEAYKTQCIEEAEDLVFDKYKGSENTNGIKDSWLWIKNIWRADKVSISAILNYDDFKGYDSTVDEATYNVVMSKLLIEQNGENGANGYYILSIIVLCVTFFSQWLTRRLTQSKNKGDGAQTPGGAMRIMMYILPVTMVIFTLNSSAVFAIYIITNSVMSTILTPISTVISNKIDDNLEKKKMEKIKVDYRR